MPSTATRDLIVGTPRAVGEPVTDLEGNVPGWVFAIRKTNVPDSEPALLITQSSDPRGSLQNLRKDRRSSIGEVLRFWEERGITMKIQLLHEIMMKPGARYSPELKAYRKMWKTAKTQQVTPQCVTPRPPPREVLMVL